MLLQKLLKRFMDQRLSAERFVDSYQVIRKVYHIYVVKLEKSKEISNFIRNTEVRPSLHCCCTWSQSEVRSLCHCVGLSRTLPNCNYPHTTYLVKTPYLPPLDYHLCHHNQWKTAPSPDSRYPDGERIYGKGSRWPARPAQLPSLHQQPRNDQGP